MSIKIQYLFLKMLVIKSIDFTRIIFIFQLNLPMARSKGTLPATNVNTIE